jgi:uncharacterized sulfatase
MKRRDFLATAGACVAFAAWPAQAQPKRQPNILWITCEDMSPQLGCYGYPEARTPHLDKLAAQGVRFTHAFASYPVCAPARSSLITGLYPNSLGSHHMRSKAPLPEGVRPFTAYLREAGYYCSNNQKEDYNFDKPADTWDESSGKAHWRNRTEKDQPFFAVFNFTVTHESQIGKLDSQRASEYRPDPPHDPDKATPPPFYPDTEVIRQYWAHYYDLITAMDMQAGEILAQLEEDGLAENTIVFFYSDHGAGIVRGKRWLYDTGLHVPLIVRWPGVLEPGSVREDLVSFVDFAPTVLSLVNLPIPSAMQGKAFLGASAQDPREYIYAARDRMDERYDCCRGVRDKRYKYIRNYHPYRSWGQFLTYPEQFGIMQELRAQLTAGNLNEIQQRYFLPEKPLEELYDTEADPFELNNLVLDPESADTLQRLRTALDTWMVDIRDLGAVPEMELESWLSNGRQAPVDVAKTDYANPGDAEVFGKSLADYVEQLNTGSPLHRLWAIQSLALAGEAAQPVIEAALSDPMPGVVYWAALAFTRSNDGAGDRVQWKDGAGDRLKGLLDHEADAARLAAAHALAMHEMESETGARALEVLREGLKSKNQFTALFAAHAIEDLVSAKPSLAEDLRPVLQRKDEYPPRVARYVLKESGER